MSPISPIIDSFLCSIAFLVLYADADDRTRTTLRLALHAFMLVNACIGYFEFVSHMRLTPYVTGGKIILHDYRSTALLGHPLVNSGAGAAYALMLIYGADRSVNWFLRLVLVAVQLGALVTFGIKPTHPATGYGYIRPGDMMDGRVRMVAAFVEKPDEDKAKAFLDQGYLWNSGNFLFRADVFLTELAREQEFRQLTYESFQVRASRYVRDNPEISAIIWVSTDGKVEWVAPNESTATFVGEQLGGDLGAGVHDDWIQQEAFAHAVNQAVAERRDAAGAAEGLVGVEQLAALPFALCGSGLDQLLFSVEVLFHMFCQGHFHFSLVVCGYPAGEPGTS